VPFINGGQPLDVPVPSTLTSLGFIIVVLGLTTVASLLASRSRAGSLAD
jgi:tellurite resistance protein TerC